MHVHVQAWGIVRSIILPWKTHAWRKTKMQSSRALYMYVRIEFVSCATNLWEPIMMIVGKNLRGNADKTTCITCVIEDTNLASVAIIHEASALSPTWCSSLLFMLEPEELARDVVATQASTPCTCRAYQLFSINQFGEPAQQPFTKLPF